jgi:hypothetical protein
MARAAGRARSSRPSTPIRRTCWSTPSGIASTWAPGTGGSPSSRSTPGQAPSCGRPTRSTRRACSRSAARAACTWPWGGTVPPGSVRSAWTAACAGSIPPRPRWRARPSCVTARSRWRRGGSTTGRAPCSSASTRGAPLRRFAGRASRSAART